MKAARLLALLAIATGCGGDEEAVPCLPGVTRACSGPGGCKGAELCSGDHTFTACDCGLGSSSSSGAGGASASTSGASGGASSASSGGAGGMSCGDTMTDPKNCGRCDHDCLGGDCVLGACQPQPFFAIGSNGQGSLAVDDDDLYLAAYAPPFALGIPKSGGAPTMYGQSGNPPAIGLDADHVVFLSGATQIAVVPKTGGIPEEIASAQAKTIVAGGGYVFWITALSAGPYSVPISGGMTQAIGTGSGWALAIDSSNVYWSAAGPSGGVHQRPIAGGPVVNLVGVGATPVAADGAFVYYIDAGQGLMKVPVGGGAATPLGPTPTNVTQLAVDATDVYYLAFGAALNGELGRIPVGGGAATTLVTGFGPPTAFAVDDASVFYIQNEPSTAIVRIAK